MDMTHSDDIFRYRLRAGAMESVKLHPPTAYGRTRQRIASTRTNCFQGHDTASSDPRTAKPFFHASQLTAAPSPGDLFPAQTGTDREKAR
jgi:hypothetical protein